MLLIIFLLASIVFGVEIGLRIGAIRAGKPSPRRDHIKHRIRHCLGQALFQGRIRERWWGYAHTVIFYAFFVFLLESIELMAGSVWQGFHIGIVCGKQLAGIIYIIQSYFASMTLAAVCVLSVRRILRRGSLRSTADAWLILSLIGLLMLSHFGVMSGHLAKGICADWVSRWLPLSHLISQSDGIASLSVVCGYIHIICVSLFLVWIPRGKHLHILMAFPGLIGQYRMYGDDGQPVTGPETPDIDKYVESLDQYMAQPQNDSPMPVIGAARTSDTTRRMRLEAYACTQCQRCTDVCPMAAAGLKNCAGPMQQMIRLRSLLDKRSECDLCDAADGGTKSDGIVGQNELWSCTQCGACERACAVGVGHTSRIVDLRRACVCSENMPQQLNRVFANLERSGNPWGYPKHSALMFDGLNEGDAQSASRGTVLIFAGCMARFDASVHQTLEKTIQMLHRHGFATVMLKDETCCGESMRKMGNEMGYIACRDKNLSQISEIAHDVIVTICPHCAQVLANDYATADLRLNVQHIWEFAAEHDMVNAQQQSENGSVKRVLHMPCLLGKRPQSPESMVAMAKSMGISCNENVIKSHCCGAGGGQFFMDSNHHSNLLVKQRVDELLKDGPDEIVTGCPFCVQMLRDEIARRTSADSQRLPGVVHISDLM